MADRHIYCVKCGKFVGIIRDAKLMKGLVFVCPSCDAGPTKTQQPTDDFMDMFNDWFKPNNPRY